MLVIHARFAGDENVNLAAGSLARNYQVQGLSVQLKTERLEVLEFVALFLLKTETCDAKNSWVFFVDNVICLVKVGFQKRGTNTKYVW